MPRERLTRKEPPMPEFVDPWFTTPEGAKWLNNKRQEDDRATKEAYRQRRLDIAARTPHKRGRAISLQTDTNSRGTFYTKIQESRES